jgi:hypothetical protein
MKHMLRYCRVEEYITGTIYHPEDDKDVIGTKNWDYNNNYAQMMINKGEEGHHEGAEEETWCRCQEEEQEQVEGYGGE